MCTERLRLFGDYRESAIVYAAAVREMADRASSGLDSEMPGLRLVCKTAWNAAEAARLALFRHEADHCCDRYSTHAAHAN
jgi:hypothetical protein